MNPLAFRIVTSTPDLLVFQDPPYVMPAIVAIFSGFFMAVTVLFLNWRSGFTRTRLVALLLGSLICLLFGIWLAGLQYEFVFSRPESRIDIRMSWFGHQVSFEKLSYTTPPVASIVTTKNTTNQLVLTFNDGRVKKLGLSTDRQGYDEVVQMVNTFFHNPSTIK